MRRQFISFALVLPLTLAGAVPSTARPLPARWAHCDVWTVVATPDPTGLAGYQDVAVLDPWHAYAVGWMTKGHLASRRLAIAAVWDGRRWSATTLQPPADETIAWELTGVAARSDHEVWAVGRRGGRPLVERYDGRRWDIVPVPRLNGRAALEAVTAIPGSSAVWVVGWRVREQVNHPLAMRWTGSRWIRTVTPAAVSGLALQGVTSTGRGAWAVGAFGLPEQGTSGPPGVLRWTGARWVRAQIPSPPVARLVSVASGSPSDVLAVGYGGRHGRGFVIRWNGRRWTPVTDARIPGLDRFGASDVAYSTAGDAWIVGGFELPGEHEWLAPAAYHRVGGRWSRTMLPTPEGAAFPEGVDAGTPHDVWVVGQEGGYDATPFAQHRC